MLSIRPHNFRLLVFTVLAAVSALLPAHACLGQTWVDQKVSGPFICRSEFPLSRVDGLLHELAQLQDDLVRCLAIPPAKESIELYFFRDKWSYTAYLKQHLPNVPYRRALYVKDEGPGKVLTYWSNDFAVDLRHECTHALLHSVLPVVPLWLDEGLAEYFEVPARARAFDNPHLESLRWSLRFGMVPRLDSLERTGSLSEMGKTDYRDAWAWVHFMFHGPREAQAELGQYLHDLLTNVPPGLLSVRLERRLPGVQQRFVAHFRGWKR